MELKALSKRGKIIVMICFIALGLIAVGGIVAAFVMNYNVFAPAAPSILDDGKNIFITTSLNENYKAYRFKFLSSTGEIIVESSDNVLTMEELKQTSLEIGGRYSISACYVGETEGSSSPYGDYTRWTYVQYLDAPSLSQDAENEKICWEAVPNATYYTVYYKDEGELKTKQTTDLFYDYSTLTGGEREFFVSAGSTDLNYMTSGFSNTLVFNHVYKMQELDSVSFNSTTCELTVVALEEIDYITVYIGQEEGRVVKLLSPISSIKGRVTYSVNISAIYTAAARIGVAPSPADEWSQFVGEIKTING